MTKLTISRERFEKMKSVLSVLIPTSHQQQHDIVAALLGVASIEVEVGETGEHDTALLAAFREWRRSPGNFYAPPDIVFEFFCRGDVTSDRLSLAERAARLEQALAQEDRAEDRRRVIREALAAAATDAIEEYENERIFARFAKGKFVD